MDYWYFVILILFYLVVVGNYLIKFAQKEN